MNPYYLLFSALLLPLPADAESRVEALVSELGEMHYRQTDAAIVERESQYLHDLAKIDEALSHSDLETARHLLLTEMFKSAYRINEYKKHLSVEMGKNEANYTLERYRTYMSRNDVAVAYPKLTEKVASQIPFPAEQGKPSGRDPQWRSYFGQKLLELSDALKE